MTVKRKSLPAFLFLVLILVAVAISSPLAVLHAQKSPITLSIAVPEYVANNLKPDAFSAFEAENPGVKVHLVKTSNDMYFPPAAYEADKHFSGAEKYAASADVLYINSYNVSLEATRAGYLLDLAPLVNGDSSLKADDFVPAVWQSYQWDRGIWALPISADVVILSYDPAAFDKAGVAYPNGKWTLDDLASAVRKLAQKDSEGKVTVPGILAWNTAPLFRSLLGESFYDNSIIPNPPQLEKPGLITLLDTWSKLHMEDLTGRNFQGDFNLIPLRVDQSWSISKRPSDQPARRGSLLPGGKAGLVVDAFAVSAGSQHPDQAYALLKFLTRDPNIVRSFFGIIPARKSLLDAYKADDATRYIPKFTPENQAVIDQALDNALPLSEMRYAEYLNKAVFDLSDKKLDVRAVLQSAQANAVAVLKTAAEKRGTKSLTVATPIPTPILKAGEVSIKFNTVAFISPLPNRDQWEKVIKEFTSSDPQVRHITLDTGFNGNLKEIADQHDCFALPYNAVVEGDMSAFLNLDPLISADTSFDKNDVIGNALAQLQRDGKIWGFPLYIQPQVLRYNTEAFAKAGIKSPDGGWTIDSFNDAVKALKVNPNDPPPFVPRYFGSTYLMMLIAAYGGLPLDYRTNPVAVNFTDPAHVEAIKQVLDLAKKGYIKYEKLSKLGGGGGSGGPFTDPIYTDSLSLLNFRPRMESDRDPYKFVTYPKGTKFTPIAYDIGAAYISAKAANPEACYRWINTLSRHPELFSAMPARRSLLDAPGTASQGADAVAYYKQIDQQFQEPNALILPVQNNSIGTFVVQFVLNRAFDRYVQENADLDVELKQAESFAKAYQGCIANIPPNTAATQQEQMTYYKQFTDCAIKIDPTLKSVFEPTQ